jgi:predicted HTH domain antitoxin
MQFTVELPDDLAPLLIQDGREPARAAVEDMALEAFRAKRLTEHQLATILGMDCYTLDGFLKQRGIFYDYTIEDLREELEIQKKLGF